MADITLGPIGSVFAAAVTGTTGFTTINIGGAGQVRASTISLGTSGSLYLADTAAGSGGTIMLGPQTGGAPYLNIRVVQPITIYAMGVSAASSLAMVVVDQDK